MQVVSGAYLIDGSGAEPLPQQMIVIGDDGRISEVGHDLRLPRDAIVIDVGGATVMPGLIDAHVHLFSGQFGSNMQERALTPPSLHAFQSMLNARETLRPGSPVCETPAGRRRASGWRSTRASSPAHG